MGPINELEIRRLRSLPDAITFLIAESESEGFRFLARLKEEWDTGENRFDLPGERLYGAYYLEELVGVCGLNQDPYVADLAIGRVRRLYVSSRFRGAGVGRALVEHVIRSAANQFGSLQLRSQPGAMEFFQSFGMETVSENPLITHRMMFR